MKRIIQSICSGTLLSTSSKKYRLSLKKKFKQYDIHIPPELFKDSRLLLNAIFNNKFIYTDDQWKQIINLSTAEKFRLLLISEDLSFFDKIFNDTFWDDLTQDDWNLLNTACDISKFPINRVHKAQLIGLL